jgi:serine/threonine protein kinase
MLNEGGLGATQVGKFMTIYPASANEAVGIAHELVRITEAKCLSGPSIVTDLHIGGAVYARYGTFNPEMLRNRLGMFVGLDGEEIGRYTVPFTPPDGVFNPFKARQPESDVPLQQKGYLILQALQVHAKGSVFLALDLRDQGNVRKVILKEGRPGCVSDDQGRDICDRLRHQESIHTSLGFHVPIAAAGKVFEHGGNCYLPLEYIPGRDIGERPAIPFRSLSEDRRRVVLTELLSATTAVHNLHQRDYIHRDLSMKNIRITDEGSAVLIDLEIASHADDHGWPYFQGTPGFVSPQQLDQKSPSLEDDVYALGAVIACALTGCDPQRLAYANPADRAGQILSLSGAPAEICGITASCLSENPTERPDLDGVIGALANET